MITIYKPPYRESSPESADEEIIRPGQPYLTKINGKLVWAREKNPKPAIGLLEEAFGVRTRVIRRRASSTSLIDREKPSSWMIGGVPYTMPLPSQPFPAIGGAPYTTPLPGQPFPPGGSLPYQPMMTYPLGYYQPPPYEPTKYTVPPQGPTKGEMDQLRDIDADYNARQSKHKQVISGDSGMGEDSMVSKTTITIVKHVCANCGRIRSRKYHKENPMKEGDKPIPAFCRKCQRDASSTDDSDAAKTPKKKASKEKVQQKQKKSGDGACEDKTSTPKKQQPQPKKKENEPAPPEVIIEGEPKHSPRPTFRKGKLGKKLKRRSTHFPDYIVDEEEYSEDEQAPRGRLRIRHEEFYDGKRPLSPPAKRSYVRTSPQPGVQSSHFDGSHERGSAQRPRIVREPLYERSPSPRHRNEQASSQHEHDNERRETREQSRFVEKEIYVTAEPAHPSRRSHNTAPPPSMPNREESFKSFSSGHSRESAQRRRRERRAAYESTPAAPWEAPHVINPQHGDEKIVVTETYVYRPRRGTNESRKENHRSADNGKVKYDIKSRIDFAEEDYAYYQNDWAHEDHSCEVPLPTGRGYRRDKFQDSELCSEIFDSVQYRKAYEAVHHDLPPRAPTPPSVASSGNDSNYQKAPPYPLSSDSETTQCLKTARKGKAKAAGRSPSNQHGPQRQKGRERSTSTVSHHRPPFVREATDGGTEKVMIPSPHRSRSPSRDSVYDEFSVSEAGLTALEEREREREAERAAEKVGRRVTFRDDGTVILPINRFDGRSEATESAAGWGGGNDGGDKW